MSRRLSVRPVLRVFVDHMKRYPLLTALMLIGRAATYVIVIIVPLFYKQFLDIAAGAAEPSEVVGTLVGIILTVGALYLIEWCFRRMAGFSNGWLEARVMDDLGRTAFKHILEHSYAFFANSFAGSLVRKVTRLSRAYEQVEDRVFLDLIPLTVILTGIAIVLFGRSALLGGIFVGWAILIIILQFVFAYWKLRYSLAAAEKDSEATGVLADSIGNDTTIKLFTGAEHERGLFGNVSSELRHLRWKAWRFDESVDMFQGLLMIGIEIVLMYAAILLWVDGQITVGDFALIQAYILTAIERIWGFGNTLRKIYEAFADATEMIDIMDQPRDVVDRPGAGALVVTEGRIEMREVGFAFHTTRDILSSFNLVIQGREKVALVGPSGAGKTTITKLLLRLHDVGSGEILIDGKNIAEVTQESLRQVISFVPQEPVLFHRTLMENIRYGRRDASDEEVKEAARKAHCEEFIVRTPEGYDTYVGERGVKLSGGERQRIAIARAILKNAPILILDEATSSLDSESEALIQDALRTLMQGKTVIAIAHRLSTVMRMDRLIVLEEGRIVMTGTHQELVSHEGGLYKKLWEIQAGGFLTDDLQEI